jgi:hypothetical protein
MRKVFLGLVACVLATPAHAALTSFTYTQGDSLTGSGTIAAFSYDPGDGFGPINFGATPMPAATVFNPNPGLTPAGFVGAQNTQSGSANEANTTTGLTWSGSVTANGTRGVQNYTISIPLKFVQKVTQTPTDTSDYNWNVTYGDNPAGGTDTITSAAIRTAMWLGRDTVIDAADTANLFQRYTQDNKSFVAGQDTFTNSDTTNTTVKDATDSGAPAGTDAAGLPLQFYFGWRDTGGLTQGALLIDTFAVGGLLDADPSTLSPPVPEPSAVLLLATATLLPLATRRRARR